ncbi:GNAT family N-acetyltransferase [Paraflavisolibacter sp. H34]|uniref:GNAT family N-acetyltransferase n=1 Tax=Huijunlia imazamoxiresistens TaxID=3127457 RepID=UPI00301AAF57
METTTFSISNDKTLLDIDLVWDYLSNRSYWARGRSRETVERSIANSLCFGLYDEQKRQVGFARVATDYAVFAWLMDVFILEDYRGQGLGKLLMQEIFSHPELQEVKRWGLGTLDAHGLYQQFGFRPLSQPERMMERVR